MEIIIPKTEIVDINLLKVDGNNPNRMSKEQEKALEANFKRFGFIIPIITNNEYLVSDGEHRLKIAKKSGLKSIPVIRLDVNEVERRILRQVLNKLRGEHDGLLDYEEFKFLDENDGLEELKELTALNDEINLIMDKNKDVQEDDFEPDLNKPPKYEIKEGDIYQLGNHRVMCGDSLNKENINKLMNGYKADMVFSDPPYAIYGSSTGLGKNVADDKMVRPFFKAIIDAIGNNSKKFAHCYICCDWRSYPSLWYAIGQTDLIPKNCIVWKKNNVGMGSMYMMGYELIFFFENTPKQKLMTVKETGTKKIPWGKENSNVWEYDIVSGKKREHNAEKPIKLIVHAIQNSSENNDLVLDLFGGSGTTLLASEQIGRRCYIMEIIPKYLSIIIERWEKFTGKKATRIDKIDNG